MRFQKSLSLSLGLTALLSITACQSMYSNINHTTASRIARPAFMVERIIDVGAHPIYAWERIRDKDEKARLYIEGSDESNPVALHLASRDRTRNMFYLAQPCQYATAAGENCSKEFYEASGPDVIDTYNAVLDEIRARYRISGFDIIGHGSGANIAAMLASERDDVLSLRTVAGNLAPAEGLSATAVAPALSNMPQHHFLGAVDDKTIPDEYHFYRQAMGDSACVHYTMVQDADHKKGWVEEWPEFLGYPIDCAINMDGYAPDPFPGLPYDKGKSLGK